jgi:hypothetical protein
MKYRKYILQELKRIYDRKGPDSYTLVHNMKTFKPGNQDYHKSFNRLIHEEMVRVMSSDGLQAIALNPERIDIIRKEIYVWYTSPKFWLTSLTVFVIIAWVMVGLT